jgi:uncharacterized protein
MKTVHRHILVGSTTPYSGKSSLLLSLGLQLQRQEFGLGYLKPLSQGEPPVDEDTRFLAQQWNIVVPDPLVFISPQTLLERLRGNDQTNYQDLLKEQLHRVGAEADFLFIEGGGTATEGKLFGLSLKQMATVLDAPVILVVRYQAGKTIEGVLDVQEQLQGHPLSVIFNEVPEAQHSYVQEQLAPLFEARGMPVLGVLPLDPILHSVSVAELVERLGAEVLCCENSLDLLVEQVNIGAMNVSSALKYFRKNNQKVVVTGGDRTDIQLAALQTATNCLVLTGQLRPTPLILARAQQMQVPILCVAHDTLTTVQIINQAFEYARFQQEAKTECMVTMMEQYFNFEAFYAFCGLEQPVSSL